ncbi:MmgE/PrpD family protein [Acuticoccus mangrovi]|uniref:MmgE/PrpD family protein n=1 Tax=Acuticoccus mangrovi TaxID=2796142 RepID=A0A934IQZ6_9HYPH|nr:MmgE/PrpD family protein [Acuticoccus mangrovi]MBJ3777111.1 MmgE/PrpD family protein [Acuticoccus mangrovi]
MQQVVVEGVSQSAARFVSELRFQDIPAPAVARFKLCLLDAIGCATFATTTPWGRILSDYVVEQGGIEGGSVWGTGRSVPPAMAALVNGTLVHSFELDDLHKSSILHPSGVVVPAALALAEARGGVSGEALIAASIAGFEVGIRAGLSVGTSHLVKGYHPTGTNGAPAAAAAAANLLGLAPREAEHAIGIAATQSAGLMAAQFESMVKRMHAGRAAQAGVVGAELAARGFTGIDHVFEAEYGGYCATLSDEPKPALIADGLGSRFETEKVGFKIYSCCGSCHTSVEAIRRLRERHAVTPGMVERIDVDTTTATYLHVGWPYEPRSITAAQMNMPYCVAATMIDGEAFVEQFTAQRIHDPEIIDLAGRVSAQPAEDLDALGPSGRHRVRVRLHLTDGTVLAEEVGHAKGSDADPLTDDEVVEKYFRLVEPVAGPAWARAVFEIVTTLDTQDSTTALSALLARPHIH